MSGNGFIKLYRSMLDWEWIGDSNTLSVFIFCLLSANHKPARWSGIEIEAGQFATSVKSICNKTRLSTKEVRTALSHLEKTGEISRKAANKYSLITVANWASYQSDTDERANKGQTKGKQRATNKNDKKEKKEIYISDYGLSGDVLQALSAMIEMRTAIKAPMTQKAVDLMVAKLNSMASTDAEKIAILNQSVMNNWKGIFPLKDEMKHEVKQKNYVN